MRYRIGVSAATVALAATAVITAISAQGQGQPVYSTDSAAGPVPTVSRMQETVANRSETRNPLWTLPPTTTAAPKPTPTVAPTHSARPTPKATYHLIHRHTHTVPPKVVHKKKVYPKSLPTPVYTVTASGSPQSYALSRVGSTQFACLKPLWNRESGWRWNAANPHSAAYGIPQANPGRKMASAGSDWRTNPITQVRWGLSYINSRYGSPCNAWAHSQRTGWY